MQSGESAMEEEKRTWKRKSLVSPTTFPGEQQGKRRDSQNETTKQTKGTYRGTHMLEDIFKNGVATLASNQFPAR
ncbi:hypothetical protein JTE90_000506 [Oedothorax gibbosus]|uniref:Uncharacterized protein n=1 Tax=Oedothorax gibbosus TaxID=931172 RepID=A0AAV6VWC8_9ARAC|nr:hypothetical protein JTE90_000506 [Oedothorax gibbosus]